jgi:predicted DNA-binding transcriptional regulator AlpA
MVKSVVDRPAELFPGMEPQDILLTRSEAASMLRRSTSTLEQWARNGYGPKVTKIGLRGSRYRLSDLRAFLAGE